MRWLLRLLAALLLVLGATTPTLAATPDGTSPATAFPLPSSLTTSGSLVGASTGAWVYYSFNYPGNGTLGAVTISVTPSDRGTSNAAGVNLYQNNAQGNTTPLLSINAVGAIPGTNSATFSSAAAGPILVQVYNYLPNHSTRYTVAITGLPYQGPTAPSALAPASGPTPAPTAVSGPGLTPATAGHLPSSLSASGTITGSGGGSYQYYTFTYPGSGQTGIVNLTVSPGDPLTSNAVGINLYQGSSRLASMNAVGPSPGVNSATFSSATAGPVLVQVYNFRPNQPATYSFTITGLTP
jgi:hypothetical protein